jgi:hypothetical protein
MGRSRNPSRVLAEHSFLRCSYQLPISLIDSSAEAGVWHATCLRTGFPRILRLTMAAVCRIRASRRSLKRPSNQRNQPPSGPNPSNKRMGILNCGRRSGCRRGRCTGGRR